MPYLTHKLRKNAVSPAPTFGRVCLLVRLQRLLLNPPLQGRAASGAPLG